jgi:hypothetical protein
MDVPTVKPLGLKESESVEFGKRSLSGRDTNDDLNVTCDKEAAKDEVHAQPPLTLKRFLALSSLTLLFMTAAIPVYFITATLGMLLQQLELT